MPTGELRTSFSPADKVFSFLYSFGKVLQRDRSREKDFNDEKPLQIELAVQNMFRLQPTIRVAKKVGKGLGPGEILQRAMPAGRSEETSSDSTFSIRQGVMCKARLFSWFG